MPEKRVMPLREWCGEVRKRLYMEGMTQHELAERCNRSYDYMRQIMSGAKRPGEMLIWTINRVVGIDYEVEVTVDELE